MSLVHIIRIEVRKGYLGRAIYRLIDREGDFILGFDRYSRFLIDKRNYPFSTLKRYSEAASRFIDYLYEVRVLGEPTTNLEINRAVEAYPHLLRAGARFEDGDSQRTQQLRAYATAIGMKEGLSRNSFPPTLAAINLLLLVAQDLAHEAAATLGPLNVSESTNAEVLISAINGFTSLSYHETKRLKQNSLLGSVMHLRGPLRRPNSLRSPIKRGRQSVLERFDFPLTRFADLIIAATCYRDKALWCLLAAGGLREHEALNLQVSHIDLSTRRIYIEDPNYIRFGRQMLNDEKVRFKGRITSKTYLFEPLRSEFFKWFELYLRNEYIPTTEHNYIFQILVGEGRGNPLNAASDTARKKSFKKTVRRASVEGPPGCPDYLWTPHSLRHLYGVYMLNYIPVPGGFGLKASEVQMLMGHKDINSTRIYARHDALMLKAKLEAADRLIFDGGFDVNSFPELIANRLMAEANKYRKLARTKE